MNSMRPSPATDPILTGYYVSARDGSRYAMLLGPYDTKAAAEANVDRAKAWVQERDSWAHFYGFGTAKATGLRLNPGKLNHRIGLHGSTGSEGPQGATGHQGPVGAQS